MATYVSRTEARTVKCPYCKVGAGAKCIGKRGEREANHRERIQNFLGLISACY